MTILMEEMQRSGREMGMCELRRQVEAREIEGGTQLQLNLICYAAQVSWAYFNFQ